MLRDVVQNTFQRATVSADYDELTVSVGKLRLHMNDLRITLRESMQEIERLRAEVAELRGLREEVAALRAGGVVLAPAQVAPVASTGDLSSAAPHTNGVSHAAPIVVPDAVLGGGPVVGGAVVGGSVSQAPAPSPGAPVTLSGIAAAIAADSAGKSPVAVDDGPIIRIAADGVAYWGPLDNASARARAAGQKLVIDQPECISCGTCVEQTDAVFVLPDDAKAVPKAQEGPMDSIQDAIDACPVTCIHWTADPGQFEQLNDLTGAKLA